jgi:hypothetical protein
MAAFELLKCLNAGSMMDRASCTAILVSGSSCDEKFIYKICRLSEKYKLIYRCHGIKEHLDDCHIFGHSFRKFLTKFAQGN